MLIQFTVENFLSFKEKTTFSMVAAGDDQHPAHVITEGLGKAPALLRAAALYGANAAGKSNLIKAIDFARTLILQGTRSGQSIPVTPFKLGGSQRPSRFEFLLTHEGVLYSYGFVLNSIQILEEWLYATPKRQEVRFFERTTLDNKEVKVEFGRTFTGRSREQAQFLEFVAKGTRPNQLFLTEARDRNVSEVAALIHWFEDLLILTAEEKTDELEIRTYKSEAFLEFLSEILRSSGTGIHAIKTEEVADYETHFQNLPLKYQEEIAALGEHSALLYVVPSGERYLFAHGEQGKPVLVLLKMQHLMEDGQLVSFELEEESEGTQRLMHLLPTLFSMSVGQGKVVLIDELDRRLHPLLSRLLVETALEDTETSPRSQLIFTTHETNLLDLDLLRRDEIWFVEKDRFGASQLYSLAEFKIRPDMKVQRGYLNGRFGAIPFLGGASKLGWTPNKSASPVEA